MASAAKDDSVSIDESQSSPDPAASPKAGRFGSLRLGSWRLGSWRTWGRSWRVRITATILLIGVISAVVFWYPRRALLTVKLAGARIELIHRLEHRPMVRAMPFGWNRVLQSFLGRNNQRLNWLGTDNDVGLIGLGGIPRQEQMLNQVRQFPNARTLLLKGPLPTQKLRQALRDCRIDRVFYNADDEPLCLDGLQDLRSLETLMLFSVTSIGFSEDSRDALGRLKSVQFYECRFQPEAFVQLATLQSYRGNLMFSRCEGIDTAALKNLCQLKHLFRLHLAYCDGIGEPELDALSQFEGLQFLTLESIKISPESVTRLRQSLPHCKLEIK